MAAHDKVRWHPPLKAPAIDVVDLSGSDSTDISTKISEHAGKNDAYSKILLTQETADGDDVQWHAPLKVPAIEFGNTLSREISTGTDDEVLVNNGNGDAKPRDASPEGSDSDEGSQWSLYEDALGEDEDEVALHSSM